MGDSLFALLYLFVGTGLSAILAFATQVLIARHTSPTIFGNYSAILATITTLAPLCGFGIAQYWLKIFGQHGDAGIAWVQRSIRFTFLTTACISLLLVAWFFLTQETAKLAFAGMVLTLIVVNKVLIELLNSVLQIERRYRSMAIWQFFQHASFIFAIVLAVYISGAALDILTISTAQTVAALLMALAMLPTIRNFIRIKHNTLSIDGGSASIVANVNITLFDIAKEAAPFGVSGLFYLIYYQLGVVFVRHLVGAEAAGYYSVAFTILTATLLVPAVIYQKFLLPKLHRWAYHDRNLFVQSYKLGNYAMLILGIMVFVLTWVLAPIAITRLFGEEYRNAIPLIRVMAINIPIVYVASSAGSLLVTQDHMKTKVVYMGMSALLSLMLSAPMIFAFGVYGAVYTNIICNAFILLIYFYKVQKDLVS